MDKFNLMLLNISNGLRPNDLKELIYICEIEESYKANITSGCDLFTRLRHDRRLSDDNVACLKDILKAIKRIDLVNHVETFEGVEKTPPEEINPVSDENARPDAETSPVEINPVSMSNQHENIAVENIAESPSALSGENHFAQILPQSSSGQQTNTAPCCAVNWPCLNMSCYKIHFCYVILIVLYLLAIIIVSLFWYANVPVVSEHLNKEASLYSSGKFVIVALILTFPIILAIVFFARKYYKKRRVTAGRSSSTLVDPGFPMVATNDDSVPPVVGRINATRDLETSDERTSSTSNLRTNHTTRDTEPILSP